ncbi:hypothetical protein GJ496_005345 [Pomphorhynchus laevis]|nr:hypothetical protein GJ496_005345 [Pomphorhynchus laevis]
MKVRLSDRYKTSMGYVDRINQNGSRKSNLFASYYRKSRVCNPVISEWRRFCSKLVNSVDSAQDNDAWIKSAFGNGLTREILTKIETTAKLEGLALNDIVDLPRSIRQLTSSALELSRRSLSIMTR